MGLLVSIVIGPADGIMTFDPETIENAPQIVGARRNEPHDPPLPLSCGAPPPNCPEDGPPDGADPLVSIVIGPADGIMTFDPETIENAPQIRSATTGCSDSNARRERLLRGSFHPARPVAARQQRWDNRAECTPAR